MTHRQCRWLIDRAQGIIILQKLQHFRQQAIRSSARRVEEIINDLSVILSVVHVDTTRPNIEQTDVFQAIDIKYVSCTAQLCRLSWSVILIVLLLTFCQGVQIAVVQAVRNS